MRYYTYDIIVKNEDIPENKLRDDEKKLSYTPSKLDREINDIYANPEEVVNMTITPIMNAGDPIPYAYHIICVTKA